MAERKVRSIRGELVDFDLLRVKQTIENRNKPDSVEMREKYIDIRRRRNPRRNVADLVDEQRQNEQDAREKIERSRAAKKIADEAKAAEEVAGKDEVKSTPDVTKTPVKKNTSRKRVIKRTQD